MHDLIFAVAFVAMVASPAMVAAIGGRKEYNPGPELPQIRSTRAIPTKAIQAKTIPGISVRPFHPTVPTRTTRGMTTASRRLVLTDGPTLPMHNARGMAGR
jgi:hypothetical protein